MPIIQNVEMITCRMCFLDGDIPFAPGNGNTPYSKPFLPIYLSELNKSKDPATQKRPPFLELVDSQDGNVCFIRADAEYPM